MRALMAAGIAVLGACSNPEEPVLCPGHVLPGVRITFIDDATGGAVVARAARLVATSSSYADTAAFEWPSAIPVPALGVIEDRPGVYHVRAAVAGFSEWQQANVRVTQTNPCSVTTVELTARLER
jgi:hypothetical protein